MVKLSIEAGKRAFINSNPLDDCPEASFCMLLWPPDTGTTNIKKYNQRNCSRSHRTNQNFAIACRVAAPMLLFLYRTMEICYRLLCRCRHIVHYIPCMCTMCTERSSAGVCCTHMHTCMRSHCSYASSQTINDTISMNIIGMRPQCQHETTHST